MKHQFVKGQLYTKNGLGITFPLSLSSCVTHPTDGEEYFFITLNHGDGYRNERQGTDIIVQPGDIKDVLPAGTREPREAYCFVRDTPGDEFTYEGIVTAIENHDPGRNILRVQ
ncbi:MAG: hypothetical protein LBI90_09760 [Treponema sp.]|jgi:hypothetical protein|nr:hypothetical protein [Treponema sp.]